MTVEIDTDRCRSAARTWARWGDESQRAQLEIAGAIAELRLADVGPSADDRLADAAAHLWTAATFVAMVADRAERADGGFTVGEVESLMALAGSAIGLPSNWSPGSGDAGGTYLAELRSPFLIDADEAHGRGLELVVRALRDTGSSTQVRVDEFEIVQLADGRFLVVLPGVTDLSRPSLGYHGEHRTVRDLDQQAVGSSRSTSVADNGYAAMVWEALRRRGVPPGSSLVLIGHSFGADTALDLAADHGFNGPSGYAVTHVVAAAYASEPQLESVPASTRVLVLQNHRDVAVIAEKVGQAHVTEAIDAHGDAMWNAVTGDTVGAVTRSADALYHDAGAVWNGVTHLWDRRDDVAQLAVGVATRDPQAVRDGAGAIVTLEPGVRHPRPAQTVVVFEGGGSGAGHAQDHYIDYLSSSDDPAVAGFLASVGGGGSTVGSSVAIDVSVPVR